MTTIFSFLAFISQVSGTEMYSTLSPKHFISFSANANVARETNKIRVDFMIDFGRNGDVMLKRSTEMTMNSAENTKTHFNYV